MDDRKFIGIILFPIPLLGMILLALEGASESRKIQESGDVLAELTALQHQEMSALTRRDLPEYERLKSLEPSFTVDPEGYYHYS
jgi:hypothetical protein